MARHGVTPAEIFSAADQLKQAAQPVTVEAVRRTLQRGSYSTINTHLRTWREKDQTQEAHRRGEKAGLNIPDNLLRRLESLLQDVWTEAWEQASRASEEQIRALKDENQQLTRQLQSVTQPPSESPKRKRSGQKSLASETRRKNRPQQISELRGKMLKEGKKGKGNPMRRLKRRHTKVTH
jgi:uncharacterized protein YdaL